MEIGSLSCRGGAPNAVFAHLRIKLDQRLFCSIVVRALRNDVGGNMIISNNVGFRPGDTNPNDSTEVDGNTVGRNLICHNNTPPALYGDAYDPTIGNGPNTVGHQALGECASLTTPPTAS